MFVTIVRFPESDALTLAESRTKFSESAASYLEVPGLLWKAYLRSEDGASVGGVYWWRNRASAEAKFNDGWLAGVSAKYGAEPQIEWFDAPVVVDTQSQSIQVDVPPTRQL